MANTEQLYDPNRPDYRCAASVGMLDAIEYVRDVSEGTLHLRSLGIKYLPREEAETDRAYKIRLSRAVLVNFYARALHSLVGLVFRNEPKLCEDVPEIMRGKEEVAAVPATATTPAVAAQPEVEGQLEDCDLAGTHFCVFAKELFVDAMRDGHAFLLTEMPPALPEGSTRADEKALNRRPYFVKYKADQALNWRLNEYGQLEQITFEECSMEPDGEFGEKKVTRYRVLRPGSWQLFQKLTVDGKDVILMESDGVTSLSEIPVSVAYGRRCHPLVSKPPLLDLAIVNIAHFNESSDVAIYRHLVGRPVWWAAGRDTSKKAPVLSPYTIIDVKDGGSVGVAESTGAALGDARTALKDMEEHMGLLGLQMLNQQTPQKTATEERGDQVRELSELATAAQSLHDCLEQGLKYWAQYLKLPSGGSIELGVDADCLMGDAAARVFLDSAGTIFSRATVRKILAKAYQYFIPDDYNDAVEDEQLASEQGSLLDTMPPVMPPQQSQQFQQQPAGA